VRTGHRRIEDIATEVGRRTPVDDRQGLFEPARHHRAGAAPLEDGHLVLPRPGRLPRLWLYPRDGR
jgi:hypothetical protein